MQEQHHQEDRDPAPHHDAQSPNEARTSRSPFALPPAEITYVEKVVTTLQGQLQQHLVGVYLFGSVAYGETNRGQAILMCKLSSLSHRACRNIGKSL